jgi:nucleoid DNA-binding protein/outer membrane biosynthesis protein TonB
MLTIKDLAEILVQKHQLDSRSAEAFINAVIETIHEGLKSDRVVKVKGFGTFKLTAVRERESINVNTGERVVISGHDKVSFTPDAVLRDLVNKPFAQFDTVVLADGVDFEDMPEVEIEDGDAAADEVADIPASVKEDAKVVSEAPEVSVVPKEPEPEDVGAPVAEPEVEVEPVVEQKPEPEPVAEEPIAEEPIAEEPIAEEPVAVEESVVEVAQPEEPESPASPETLGSLESSETIENSASPAFTKEPEQEENQEETPDYISEFYEDADDNKRMFLIYAIIVNVVVAALFFVFGYYARSTNLLGIEKEQAVETPAAPAVEKPDTTKQKTVEPAAPAKVTEEPTVEKTEEKPVEESKPVAEQKKEEKPQPKAESTVESTSKYDNDPRVRTGAYRIVGVANTVTVRSGQTIKSISKTYLGPGMECYVEAFNGGITELKEGQTIKIPKLALKKKSAKAKK